MTFTVTPQPNNVPPRVRIDINSDNPARPFTALTITRDGRPIREQPFVGSAAAVVFDYEAPFGVSADYAATGATSTYTILHSEAWASLSGWTISSGSVSGGQYSGGTASRTLTIPSSGRLEAQGITPSPPVDGWAVYSRLSVGRLVIQNSSSGGVASHAGGPSRTIGGLSSAFSATWDSGSATITTSAGSWVLTAGSDAPVNLLEASMLGGGSIKGFVVSTGTTTPFAAVAAVTLEVDKAWLIHPSQPSLSRAIDSGHGGIRMDYFVEATTADTKSSQASSTTHQLVGRRRPIVITSGPRQADEWTMVIGSRTILAKDALRAMLDDQTPLLLRSPTEFGWDLPDDWYSVGDVSIERVTSPFINEMTLTTLPLTPVDEPIVRQGALWTYGSDLLANPTYADSRSAFSTYLDRLAGAS